MKFKKTKKFKIQHSTPWAARPRGIISFLYVLLLHVFRNFAAPFEFYLNWRAIAHSTLFSAISNFHKIIY